MMNRGVQMLGPDKEIPQTGDVEEVEIEHIWLETKDRKLPYVFRYIGWSLCFLSVVASCFFTFMYSLYWGGEKANQWLTSFLLSTGESICIINTGQVGETS